MRLMRTNPFGILVIALALQRLLFLESMKKVCLYTSQVLNFAFKITDIIVYSERRSSFSHHVVVSDQDIVALKKT